MKNAVFWDVTPCESCKNVVSEDGIASIIRVKGINELRTLSVRHVLQSLVTADVPISLNLFTLMMAIRGTASVV
jgi:hypothetical protein